MKIAAAVVLGIIVILLGGRVYSFFVQERELAADLSEINDRLSKAKYDEANLQSEVQYLANPLNLQKEMRARFNYKKPGETMIVIVPPESTTATSSTGN